MVGRNEKGVIFFSVRYRDINGELKQKKQQNKKWKTLREAKEAEKLFLASVSGSHNAVIFDDLYNLYLDYQTATKRPSTIRNLKYCYDNYFHQFYGKKIDKITKALLSRWQIDLLSKGLRNGTIEKAQKCLRAIFNFGVKFEYISRNPFTLPFVRNNDEKKQEMQTWTIEEFRQFISVIDNAIEKALFETLFYSACRIGELMAIEIRDFQNGYITINKQITKEGITQAVKNKNGNRIVPLPKNLADELEEIIEKYYYGISDKNNTSWLFCGLPYRSRKQVEYHKNEYCKLANVKQIRLHDFRHSMVTYLLADNKFTYKEVADFIGDDVKSVIDTYGHTYGDLNNKILSALNEIK